VIVKYKSKPFTFVVVFEQGLAFQRFEELLLVSLLASLLA
jgi:hypothetical protein